MEHEKERLHAFQFVHGVGVAQIKPRVVELSRMIGKPLQKHKQVVLPRAQEHPSVSGDAAEALREVPRDGSDGGGQQLLETVIHADGGWKNAQHQHIGASAEFPHPIEIGEQEPEKRTRHELAFYQAADPSGMIARDLRRGGMHYSQYSCNVVLLVDFPYRIDFLRYRERMRENAPYGASLRLPAIQAEQEPEGGMILRFLIHVRSNLHFQFSVSLTKIEDGPPLGEGPSKARLIADVHRERGAKRWMKYDAPRKKLAIGLWSHEGSRGEGLPEVHSTISRRFGGRRSLWQAEQPGHADQRGHGLNIQFRHDPSTVHLDRFFLRAQQVRDLLVQHARYDERKDFILTRCQGADHASNLRQFRAPTPVMLLLLQRPIDGLEEAFLLNGLHEEVDRTSLHGSDARGDVSMTREENDGEVTACAGEPVLKIETIQARHLHVKNETACHVIAGNAQK